MDEPAPTVVIGGGIAGLATAWALGRRGARVTLVEAEPTLCSHSSGRNAAIFRCVDLAPGAARLALRTAALFDELLGGRAGWLRPTGVLYVGAGAAQLEPLRAVANAAEIPHERVEGAALLRLAPALAGGSATHGLLSPSEGVMDLHLIQQALIQSLRSAGGSIHTGSAVRAIRRVGAITGVDLASGEALEAAAVVVAAGAWAAQVGGTAGAPLPLEPRRRHLAILEPPQPISGPVVWRVDDEVYFREESGGVLACPCDETPAPSGVPAPEPSALVRLGRKLSRTAPGLADSAVRRSWAGLRTFAPDRQLVVGADPRVPGLYWLAGLGGHGMSVGVAAGELLATLISRQPHPLEPLLSPQRLLGGPAASGSG